MNAQNIDWTQAPEGYDYYIVDTAGEYPAEFHYKEQNLFLGTIYVDGAGLNWIGGDDRIEIYERPEQSAKPVVTHLRCIEADNTASHFTVGKTYEVLETTPQTGSHSIKDDFGSTVYINGKTLEFVGWPSIGAFEVVSGDTDESKVAPDEFNDEPYEFDTASEEPEQDQGCVVTHLRCISSDESDDSFSVGTVYEVLQSDGGWYMLMGDDDATWAIAEDTLEFAGCPEIGTFEIAKVGDSVEPEPEKTGTEVKSQLEFGAIVHSGGTPYVFIRIDEDGDYFLVNSDGGGVYCDLDNIDEYATQSPVNKFRENVLYQLETTLMMPLTDRMDCEVTTEVATLIDFIIEHKDTWQ